MGKSQVVYGSTLTSTSIHMSTRFSFRIFVLILVIYFQLSNDALQYFVSPSSTSPILMQKSLVIFTSL